MIHIAPNIEIDEKELQESFIRASGPGGQNVNKVSTAVQLRFDVRSCSAFSDAVRARLEKLAGHRLTLDGVLVITAQQHRSQDRNRTEARDALIALIRQALVAPIKRRPTRPSAGAKLRRLEAKTHRAGIKQGRGRQPSE